MKFRSRSVLALAGVIAAVVGVIGAVPSALKENYLVAVISTLLLVGGLVLLAISFED